ncbi:MULTISPECIES: translesion error-prone DNA polymerase V autoproteolytic subunit [Alcanivorax]|jgi:DNA polymerase V|uniref:translesion error-prone DNA polymerase V autoproteolytic subunit n=1 Tax=Alcanivorax TaxID=59753 RepID=UPI000C421E38|nr:MULTISPECIES: translesion error-prone DNA polymerase V autoproteolytic subunit [Alcanivorax]MBG33201.1 UV protection and mutation protein [Alcanivorax sp.]MDF1636448.1 translesion error-prone DNA polymerase V autoproteolytic subunit [Alcanivorax jadensis]|tara:strand:+ start:6327 stop:6758 length:432 start_codon:yes stop_codon:yes gene_type:complete
MKAEYLGKAGEYPLLELPLFVSTISAGFPSPAQDHIEQRLDLNTLCIEHPNATFFARATGDSMIDSGIYPGDILVVDRAIEAGHGDIVIAALDGDFTVKELCLHPQPCLKPHNKDYQSIPLSDDTQLDVFGVVTYAIHKTYRK